MDLNICLAQSGPGVLGGERLLGGRGPPPPPHPRSLPSDSIPRGWSTHGIVTLWTEPWHLKEEANLQQLSWSYPKETVEWGPAWTNIPDVCT